MRLVVIRHLPTAWNLEGRYQGRHDEPILPPDKVSWQHVQENRSRLQQFGPFSVRLASTLIRTQQTARVYGIDDFGIEPLLDELDFGQFEGQHRLVLETAVGSAWRENPSGVVLGESIVALAQRILEFVEKYQKCESVLAFGHGAWMRALISVAQKGDVQVMNRFVLKNNAFVMIDWSASRVCILDHS